MVYHVYLYSLQFLQFKWSLLIFMIHMSPEKLGINTDFTVRAVSYTHLDVYKRQDQGMILY